jgi:hypothetical protein
MAGLGALDNLAQGSGAADVYLAFAHVDWNPVQS